MGRTHGHPLLPVGAITPEFLVPGRLEVKPFIGPKSGDNAAKRNHWNLVDGSAGRERRRRG